MSEERHGIWRAVGFTVFFLLLVALAMGSVNLLQLAVFLLVIVSSLTYLLSVFPGSRFFSIAVANFLALYTSLFHFFLTTNFSSIDAELGVIGFTMPVLGFFGGTWLQRKSIKSIVLSHKNSDIGIRAGAARWLLPVSLIGIATFFVPAGSIPLLWEEAIFFLAMGGITLVVMVVSKQVATFLLDVGLLFESFFLRIESLIMPAFAFLTFYSMNVMIFGFIYRIIDHYSSAVHFSISGVVKPISFSESLYFSIITLSTVGFGDIVPLSHVIKAVVSLQIIVSVMLLLFGFSEIMSFSKSRPKANNSEARKKS
ncbi:potassium channel family protein [Kiloniella antarctica]|uniref:Potassium channel family protein n=1 Tax=Kiloniella antarctica TaxID=1550907 RepID=A0ABW5BH23_9PROT